MNSGVEFERAVRRLQAALRGPFWGGKTRIALQLRRQALQIRRTSIPVDELVFDGFTLQADWAAPLATGLMTTVRWDQDRRRGVLAEGRSFHGVRGGASWSGHWGGWSLSGEGALGHQEPYGSTWEAAAMAALDRERWGVRLSLSHEEDLPALVSGIERGYPEHGLPEHLDRYENTENPETRTGLRVEGSWRPGRLSANLGGWATAQRNYRIDSNPLWFPVISPYGLSVFPLREADILGVYGEVRLDLGRGFFADGKARAHNRDELEVPYLPAWTTEGALHWRRLWFSQSMDLDASVGGILLGPRSTPAAVRYPAGGYGYVRLVGRVDNGVLTLSFENLLDAYLESDFRDADAETPLPLSGRTFLLGLTMYLTD